MHQMGSPVSSAQCLSLPPPPPPTSLLYYLLSSALPLYTNKGIPAFQESLPALDHGVSEHLFALYEQVCVSACMCTGSEACTTPLCMLVLTINKACLALGPLRHWQADRCGCCCDVKLQGVRSPHMFFELQVPVSFFQRRGKS